MGAAEEVTGSKHFIDTGNSLVMLDCGAFQGKRAEADKKNRDFPVDPGLIECVVLTHGHFDHSGLIPLLVRNGYRGNIFATPATRDIANIIMMDSARIQARDMEFLAKEADKRGEDFKWEPLYDERDAIKAASQFVTISYGRPIRITKDLELTFYDAGHILGSSIAVFRNDTRDGPITLAYSGDLGRKGKPIIKDPERIPDPDYLILESTYGDRLHESSGDVMGLLADVVCRTAERGGKLIIPAFAIERTQELVFYLHLLNDRKMIPKIPIFVDSPMATNATTLFTLHPECYDEETNRAFIDHHRNPFGFNDLRYVQSVAESKQLNELKGPAVIISASGMCESGRIQHHLLHNLSDEKNTILSVGYMAEHTLGRKIMNGAPEVSILGRWVKVKAEVAEIKALSAHADYRELGDYVKFMDLDRLKGVFLVHGEKEAQDHLREHLLDLGVKNVSIMAKGQKFDLKP
ncbi:MAG: MBL fold metallo-hydrolase [Candidatus Wallbacteria bacterium HGW-Wallbacteria-1]|jgi:metallo-beta-lactamase family protein|uniref:MBL fold metallo-hydrolase n=1 Tax=Candidatus Wallbacteria bacterium HGW-Wallbacteria-1 TaxID=2013854 RepID=A0A2N1PN39_9BACT|nr:MAG: MBL fold metallo-hydrolase [Candidatus Wallbacteria bacterium HGW-Wallbacteria-1]